MKIDYSMLPDYMQGGARRYLEKGERPGSFLQAVLWNDLQEAFGRADTVNLSSMFGWARFLHEAPPEAWGSKEKVEKWIAHNGLKGEQG